MAPIATPIAQQSTNVDAKPNGGDKKDIAPSNFIDFNPFHPPPSFTDTSLDSDYPFAEFKPSFPTDLNYAPLEPLHNVIDRGAFADKTKKNILGPNAGTEVRLTANIGSEIKGLQLNKLTDAQKDELALLAAERGVLVFRDQDWTIEEQLELGRYMGELHQHPTSGIPRRRGLEDVHVVYSDETQRPTSTAYTKVELFHSDVTYEVNPPAFTSLHNLVCPTIGGDTLYASGYALYDSLSEPMKKYLESLSALHTSKDQSDGARAAGQHIRRPPVDSVHPVVRTHPATGWKSVFVNPGFVKCILGVPKTESDTILNWLYTQMACNSDLNVRIAWEPKTTVIWDNRIVNHSASYDFWPERRHALRVTAMGEIPSLRLPDGSEGRSRQEEIWEKQGLDVKKLKERELALVQNRGFKD